MHIFQMLYSFDFVLLLACAAFFYKAADFEDAPAILWGALSVVLFLFTWLVLHWRIPGNLAGQAALLGAITVVRVFRDRKEP